MPVFQQGIFDTMLGYSLKRDYLGDSLNWRNIETFDFEVQLTDMPNITTNVSGFNYLSTFITGLISAKLNTDKKNITIKSIKLPNSNDALGDLIRGAKYDVTAEVRKTIDQATLLAQHPELDDTAPGTGQDGEDHKFRGVKDIFLTYAKEIDSISESFSFEDKEDGDYLFTHNLELGLRPRRDATTGVTLTNSKTLAGSIATALFAEDTNNEYFGHNAFTNALKDYGHSANNRHYFDESYDTFKGKYSFTKKMTVLPLLSLNSGETATTNSYTQNKKYSIDFNADGKVNVTETTQIKSRNANWTDIRNSVPDVIDNAYSHCIARLTSYTATIDGQSQSTGTGAVAAILSAVPTSQNVTYDPQGLKATVTVSFSNDKQAFGNAQVLETVDLSKDHRGVLTAIYNLTLTSHRQKIFNADSDIWSPAYCSDSAYTNKTDCQNNGAAWTPNKTPLDILKAYEATATAGLCAYVNYANLASTAKGVFWNTLSYWWPSGSDHIPYSYPTRQNVAVTSACQMHPVSTTISASTMGKVFTLTKTYTNDVNRDKGSSYYSPGFKKIEVKWNDTWPSPTINEHPIINRGTSWFTSNQPRTSVLANAFHTQPGKRSVTINAVLKRPVTNNLTNPVMPTNALRALAHEAKQTLMQVFLDDRFISVLQIAAYVSNISYTYNSASEITLTAELTYTVKFLPTTPGFGSPPGILLPPSAPLPPSIP